MSELERRRDFSLEVIERIRKELKETEKILRDVGSIYLTGSYGRLEAREFSDIDLFIIENTNGMTSATGISNLDIITVKAELIKISRSNKIPDFDADGRYLEKFTTKQFTETMGTREDDAQNTFTARLLLILESRPFVGESVYNRIVSDVVAEYWSEFKRHQTDFVPAFLINDILRLWRTFCVNYEVNTKQYPEEDNAKRRLKNFKLKHSRLLSCYSAILFMLDIHERRHTITKEQIIEMVAMSPIERVHWVLDNNNGNKIRQKLFESMTIKYEEFLQKTNKTNDELVNIFMDERSRRELTSGDTDFGDAVAKAINSYRDTSVIHRLLMV